MAVPLIVGGIVLGYRLAKGAHAAYKGYKALKKAQQLAKAAKKAKEAADAAKKAQKAAKTFSKTKKGCTQGCPKSIAAQRSRAVREAWKQERELVRRTGNGTRQWTQAQKKELLATGKVKGYQGHHVNNVKHHPELAGNPNNIKFVKRGEHLKEHGGNFRNETTGPLIKRTE